MANKQRLVVINGDFVAIYTMSGKKRTASQWGLSRCYRAVNQGSIKRIRSILAEKATLINGIPFRLWTGK